MLALAGILTYGGFRVQAGALTLGVVVAFLQYGLRFFRPIQDLSEKYNILQVGHGVVGAHFQAAGYATPRCWRRASPQPAPAAASRAIEFDHVWFAYKDEDWVLRDVSFTHRARRDHRGGGPHRRRQDHAHQPAAALLRCAEGQHPRSAAWTCASSIRWSCAGSSAWCCRTRTCSPERWRRTSGWARRASAREEVEAAAEQVNLLDFIRGLPEGFAHPIRERGSGLSTGQKQLISFARALAHNPRYLILDEATSSVDTETEFRVRDALSRMVEGRTSIVIAHRLSTIQRADRILVMHKGRLRESGTHQELLAQRGIYWKLYQLQYKDQERVAQEGGFSQRR